MKFYDNGKKKKKASGMQAFKFCHVIAACDKNHFYKNTKYRTIKPINLDA